MGYVKAILWDIWEWDDGIYLSGVCIGHNRIKDYHHFRSTAIQSVELEGDGFVFTTQNTKYYGEFGNMSCSSRGSGAYEETEDEDKYYSEIPLLNLINHFQLSILSIYKLTSKLMDLEDKELEDWISDFYMKYFKEVKGVESVEGWYNCVSKMIIGMKKSIKEKTITENLDDKTLLVVLNDSPSVLYTAARFADKSYYDENVKYHGGMFQDSVLIRKVGVYEWCYFPRRHSIEVYHWSDGLDKVILRNLSDKSIEVINGNHKGICKKGEDYVLINDADGLNEGLLSPDCVNGKSLLGTLK